MLKRACIVLVLALALTLASALIAIPTGAQDQTYYTSPEN
jgi:ABC-type microcin C transport system permease subunit YejE